MTISTNIHDVVSVRVEEPTRLSVQSHTEPCFTRKILISTSQGTEVEITLFAEDPEALTDPGVPG